MCGNWDSSQWRTRGVHGAFWCRCVIACVRAFETKVTCASALVKGGALSCSVGFAESLGSNKCRSPAAISFQWLVFCVTGHAGHARDDAMFASTARDFPTHVLVEIGHTQMCG